MLICLGVGFSGLGLLIRSGKSSGNDSNDPISSSSCVEPPDAIPSIVTANLLPVPSICFSADLKQDRMRWYEKVNGTRQPSACRMIRGNLQVFGSQYLLAFL